MCLLFLLLKLKNKNLIWLFNESHITLAFYVFYQGKKSSSIHKGLWHHHSIYYQTRILQLSFL